MTLSLTKRVPGRIIPTNKNKVLIYVTRGSLLNKNRVKNFQKNYKPK